MSSLHQRTRDLVLLYLVIYFVFSIKRPHIFPSFFSILSSLTFPNPPSEYPAKAVPANSHSIDALQPPHAHLPLFAPTTFCTVCTHPPIEKSDILYLNVPHP